MNRIISVKVTSILLLIINLLVLLFHSLILFKIVPSDFIWGGQIKNDSQLVMLESISICISFVFILIIALKAGFILKGKFKKITKVGLWIMFVYMLLNTIGNLASSSGKEKAIMTPLTIVLAFLIMRLAIDRDS